MGVLKIVRPLEHEIENTQAGLRGAFVLIGAISAILILISVSVTVLAQQTRKAAAG